MEGQRGQQEKQATLQRTKSMDCGDIDYDIRFLMIYYDSGQPSVDGVPADYDCYCLNIATSACPNEFHSHEDIE